jgi:hypothetical protein
MGKSTAYYHAPTGARKSPAFCLGCGKPIKFGERCPPCASELRRRTTTRRRVAYANRG